MSKAVRVILGLIGGYAAGAAIGLALVSLASSNTHDKSLEAVMTAAFFTGPLGAVAGVLLALAWKGRPPA